MHDIFSCFNDCEISEILIDYSKDLDLDKFISTRFYIQKLINYIIEERNVSNLDIYRALFIFNFNYNRMQEGSGLSKFDRYLFKRYFLAGGNRNIIDKLNCSKIERSILENDEHEGRLGFVLNLFVPLEKRSSVDLSIEVPKIYNANCFMIEDDSIEIFVMKDNPVLKK